MELGALLVILAIGIIVIMFITRPFSNPAVTGAPLKPSASSQSANLSHAALLAERERILAALQELDFDHALGKIPAADYPPQRAVLLQKGAEVFKLLDETTPPLSAQPLETKNNQHYRRHVQLPVDDLENQIAERRKQLTAKTSGFCPKCGKPIQKGDVYCSRCGTALEEHPS